MNVYENAATSGVFLVPSDVKKHLPTASAAELKVLLYLFSQNGKIDPERAAKELQLSQNDVDMALSFWRGAGLLRESGTENEKKNGNESAKNENGNKNEKTTEPPQKPRTVTVVSDTPYASRVPQYSPSELADAIENNEDVRSMLRFVSQQIGKLLTPAEQTKLFALFDTLGMPCDLIMGIVTYCVENEHKSVSYIERTAARMFEEDGITTYAAFEHFIEARKKKDELTQKIRNLIGSGDRALTPAEKRVIEKWNNEKTPTDLIAAAYERTIHAIAKPSLPYMAKMLDTWKENGIATLQALEDAKPFSAKSVLGSSAQGSFRLEDYTEMPPKLDE